MLNLRFGNKNVLKCVPIIMLIIMPYLPCNGVTLRIAGIHIYQYQHIINYILAAIFLTRKNYHPSKGVIYSMVFYCWLLVSTIINHGEIIDLIIRILQCITFFVISDYYLKFCQGKFVKSIIIMMIIIMLVNVPQQIVELGSFAFGAGTNKVNFFVSDNFACYYFVAILCLIFCYKYSNRSLSSQILSYVLIGLIVVSTVVSWSATGLSGVVIFLFISILIKRNNEKTIKQIEKIYNGKTVFVLCVSFFLAVVVFRLQDHFAFVIEGVLKKQLTFSGRVTLWDYSYLQIIKHPILGGGSVATGRTVVGLLNGIEQSAHNMILEIILQGGIIALAAYLVWMVSSIKELKKNQNNMIVFYIMTAILSEFVMYMFEGNIYYQFPFIVFILAYHVGEEKG